jgi:transposase
MMAERSVSERALRVELGELRARVAERDRTIVLLTDENAALRAHGAALAVRLVALAERVEELERRLGQNPRNSHKPPSSEGYEKPAPRSRRERTDRSSGGQPGHHQGTTLRQVETPDEVVAHEPAACRSCGGSLSQAPVVSTEARQVFDLPPITLRVVEHVLQHRLCGCGAVTMADPQTSLFAPSTEAKGRVQSRPAGEQNT